LDFPLANPSGVAVNPSGTIVYITNYGSATLSFFDASGNTFSSPNIAVGTNPVGVSLSMDGKFTYVVNKFDGTIAVIDNSTNTEKLPRIKVGATPMLWALLSPPLGKPYRPSFLRYRRTLPQTFPWVRPFERFEQR
jgi:YVTN family beta-propeller protein